MSRLGEGGESCRSSVISAKAVVEETEGKTIFLDNNILSCSYIVG